VSDVVTTWRVLVGDALDRLADAPLYTSEVAV
jgi:hypothetical protein